MARNPESLKNLKAGNKRGPAKVTKALKDAILAAAESAGNEISEDGKGGTVAYLIQQAKDQPAAFMGLLGKVLPLTLAGDPNKPISMRVEWVVTE